MRLSLLALLLCGAPAWAQPVVVVNQGAFGADDGSVTVLPDDLGGAAVQRFENQLGSILQSAALLGDQLYLVSNSANRIEVVDASTFARVGQIAGGFSSPRYLVDAGDQAYVSNQVYGGTSYVLPVDLAGRTPGTPIEVDGLPEGMAPVPALRKVYVALGAFGPGAGGVDSLAVLDVTTDAVAGYVEIGCYASFVLSDLGSEVLAFCPDTDEAVVVDVATDAVVQRIAFGEDIGDPFGVGQGVAYGATALARRAIPAPPFYVVTASGVAVLERGAGGWAITRRVAIPDADTLPVSTVGVRPDGALLLGRPDPAAPFSADGTVTVHDGATGALLATYAAGVYPAAVVAQDEAFFVAAADAPAEAAGLGLALAGPNPLRQSGALALTLGAAADVRVVLVDVLGRTVAVLAEGTRAAGTHRIAVDAGGLPAGTYLARVTAGGRAATLPLTVAR